MYKSWVLTVHTGAQWWCSMKLTFPVGKNYVSIQNMLYIQQHAANTQMQHRSKKCNFANPVCGGSFSQKCIFAILSGGSFRLERQFQHVSPQGALTKCTSVSNFRGGIGSTRSSVAESGSESRQKELDPKKWTQTKITASRFELKQRNFVF